MSIFAIVKHPVNPYEPRWKIEFFKISDFIFTTSVMLFYVRVSLILLSAAFNENEMKSSERTFLLRTMKMDKIIFDPNVIQIVFVMVQNLFF